MNRRQLGELATQLNVWWIPSGTCEIFSAALIFNEIMRVRDIGSLNFRSIRYEIFIFAATLESNEATNTLFLYNYIYKKKTWSITNWLYGKVSTNYLSYG